MRLPNGYGGVVKCGGQRRKPFQARITAGYTDEGKQIYKSIGFYKTKQEAINALAEYNNTPYNIDNNKLTFIELYNKWQEQHFKKIGQSTINSYKTSLNYCKDIYNIRFVDLRLNHLKAIIDNCNRGYSIKYGIRNLLNQLYDYAIQNDIVEKKYSKFLEVGKPESKEKQPFTEEEIQKLFDNADKIPFVDTVLIMIFTGLRISELLTIENSKVNLEERYMIGGMKTDAGKDRTIPLNKKIIPYIKRYYNPENKYLINFEGKPLKYSKYKTTIWENIMQELGMQHNPHECRHTTATMLDNVTPAINQLVIKKILRT